MGRFVEVYRIGLKVSAGKSKVMVLGGEGELECEVYVDGKRLEHVSEFKYPGCFGRMRQSAEGRWRVGGGLQVLLGL